MPQSKAGSPPAGFLAFGGLMVMAAAVNLAYAIPAAIRAFRRTVLSKELKHLPMYKLKSANVLVHLSPLGASIQRLYTKDRYGKMADVVLGHDDLVTYKDGTLPYMGVIVGRVANRIANSSFTLDGVKYKLFPNNGKNCLHGGEEGFDKKVWDVEEIEVPNGSAIKFTRESPHMEEGFPGNLKVSVTYTLTEDGELACDMKATTDAATVVNMAGHSYFNLRGHDYNDILYHKIQINSNQYLEVGDGLIPTGEYKFVDGTPFDFREEGIIGKRIHDVEGGGYDHCYVLRKGFKREKDHCHLAATVYEQISGREMSVYTNQNGVQFYTSNFLGPRLPGKAGALYNKYGGLCLETQGFPDAPNQSKFPSVVLRPGQRYHHRMVYVFGTRAAEE